MNEWSFFVQNGWIQNGRVQDHCHHQVESEWMSEVYFCEKWLNPWWLPSSSWVRMNEDWISWRVLRKMADGRIQDGRIQDGCHHQVKWEWMSLSQIELVWVRVRVERECFWVNLREDTRCLNPRWQRLNLTWQNSRWLPSSSWVRMNEWSFFVQIVGTNLGKCFCGVLEEN